jgi:hypothetical protein
VTSTPAATSVPPTATATRPPDGGGVLVLYGDAPAAGWSDGS